MNHLRINLKSTLIIFVVTILILMCIYSELRMNKGSISGYGNFSQWNFKKQGAIALRGEWEFYYNQLLSPEDFKENTDNKPELTGYIKVPSSWKGIVGEDKLKGKAFATYRLVLNIKPSQEIYAMRVSNIRMASKVFINGSAYGESGTVGVSRESYEPDNRQYVPYFNILGDKVEIIIQVTNFDFDQGGLSSNLLFGLQKDVRSLDFLINSLELSAAIIMLILSLHYFSIYYIRREDISFFYASLFFFFLALTVVVNGEKVLFEIFTSMPFELSRKLQAYASNLVIVPFLYFFRSIKEELVPKILLIATYACIIPYIVFATIAPYYIYSSYQSIVFFIVQIIDIIIFIISIRLYITADEYEWDKKELKIVISMLLSILGFFISSVLHSVSIINSSLITILTFLIFIITISVLLAYRFSAAYIKMEKISEQLIKIDKLKDEFLAVTSHELKTPLHGIINISDALAEKFSENSSNKDLFLIKNMAEKLSSIVDDILDLTRLKNNTLSVEITTVNLNACANLTLEILKYIVQGKNIVFINEIEEDCIVLADEKRLRQVLFNLVDNAVKHTEKGYIKISSKTNKNYVNIYVEDSGCGIPKDMQQNIFKAYEKFDSKGMGLGLYISFQLLQYMNGDISLQWSQEGKGSSFVFSLPLSNNSIYSDKRFKIEVEPEAIYSRDKLEYYCSEESNTILVVDDEISNIHVALKLLGGEGYNVLSALSGEEALHKLRENKKIDLVLLDIMLPGLSGVEVCRIIRENYSLIDLPILICTVRNSQQDFLIGFKAGANDFITKPFNAKEMKARVRTLITMKNSVKDAVRSELAFLQAQIRPHFLYNAINAIIYFCYTDGEKAARLLSDFSKYLRLSFDVDTSTDETTIERELELVKAYVSIEKARFQDEINVEYDVDNSVLNTKIPVLSIQPLVENAIRHGLCKKENKGLVQVIIKKQNKSLLIQITDNGIGMSKESLARLKQVKFKSVGVGFANVKKRISKLSGADFDIESTEGLGTMVTIRLYKF